MKIIVKILLILLLALTLTACLSTLVKRQSPEMALISVRFIADSPLSWHAACPVEIRNVDTGKVIEADFKDPEGVSYFGNLPAGRYALNTLYVKLAQGSWRLFFRNPDSIDFGFTNVSMPFGSKNSSPVKKR